MAQNKSEQNGRFWLTISLILLLAFALRVHNLTADAPLGVSPTLELSLDGPNTITAGRNMALFENWDAFPGPRQTHIMYPLMNWLAFLSFRLLGMGYWSANFISVVTGLLSVALIAGFARQQFSDRAALFAAFLLAINYIYINYNRDPMAYTTVACGMTFALYAWGLGLRQPAWFFISGAGAAFAALFIKLPAISFYPAALIAFLWLIGQKRSWRNGRSYLPMLLFAAGALLVVAVWTLLLYQPQPETVGSAYYARVVNPVAAFEDSVRTMIGSILYMGVDFSFSARMLPLFILAYGYTFGRLAQLASRRRPLVSAAELLLLTFLLTTLAMLLVTFIRPLRFQIVLIPLMCLTAGAALDRLWKKRPLALPTKFGRLFPLLLYGGLAFLVYQLLMAAVALFYLQPTQPGFAERWYAPDVPVVFMWFMMSLIVALPLTMAYLVWASRQDEEGRSPGKRPYGRLVAGAFLLAALLLQLYQYAAMMQTIQFTTVAAARQIAQELPAESTILAGPFALPLALESRLPAVWLLGKDEQTFRDTAFTHLAIDAAGTYAGRYYTEVQMRETMPDLFLNAELVRTYEVRGYTVHVYAMKK